MPKQESPLTATLLSCVALLLIAMIMPIAWHDYVVLDIAQFTAEWYKRCIDVGLLLGGFVLANVLWESHKKISQNSIDQKWARDMLVLWQRACHNAYATLKGFDESLESHEWSLLEQKYPFELHNRFETLIHICEIVTNSSRTQGVTQLTASVHEFQTQHAEVFRRLLTDIREGRVLPQEVRDPKIQVAIGQLRTFVDNASRDLSSVLSVDALPM